MKTASTRSLRALLVTITLTVALAPPARGQSGRFDVLVSSRTTNSVKRFDGDTGAYLGDFVLPGSGGLSATQEVLVGPDGHFLVSGRFTSNILKFDRRTGAFLGQFSSGYPLQEPTKMAFGPDGHLYVSQWAGNTTVVRFDGNTGAFIDEVTPTLNLPMQPAWDDAGLLHVVSFGSTDVRSFENGALVDIVTSGVQMLGPVNLWFDGPDLMVIDWQVGAVRRFDASTGAYQGDFITGMTNAEGYDWGPDGSLFIADWGASVVNAYDADTGVFDRTFVGGGGLSNPNSVLFVERLPDFLLTLPTSRVTVTRGQSVDVVVNVMPERALAFDDPVALSCSGLPAATSCSFSTASVVPGLNGAAATLTVNAAASAGIVSPGPWLPLGWLVAALAAFVILGLAGSQSTRIHLSPGRLAFGLATSLILLVGACGGPTGPTATGEVADITVRATSGDLVRNATITLTINPS